MGGRVGGGEGKGDGQPVYQLCWKDAFVGSGLGDSGYPKAGECSYLLPGSEPQLVARGGKGTV